MGIHDVLMHLKARADRAIYGIIWIISSEIQALRPRHKAFFISGRLTSKINVDGHELMDVKASEIFHMIPSSCRS